MNKWIAGTADLPLNDIYFAYVGQMVKHTSLSGTNFWPIVCIKVSYKLYMLTPPWKTSVAGKIPTLQYWEIMKANISLSSLGFVQYLQYYYQSGCLYRLKALGERHNLDLTVGKDYWVYSIFEESEKSFIKALNTLFV